MKKSRFSEEQAIGLLKQAEAGIPLKHLCRKGGSCRPEFPFDWSSSQSRFSLHGWMPKGAAALFDGYTFADSWGGSQWDFGQWFLGSVQARLRAMPR